jgi:hypothetical protein
MVGTYNGTLTVPAVGNYRSIALTITSEDANGNFVGSYMADGYLQFNFTGTVAADGTFTYNFASALNSPHATGPVTGNGTGTGGGTSALAFTFSATSAGYTAPGSMNVTKA